MKNFIALFGILVLLAGTATAQDQNPEQDTHNILITNTAFAQIDVDNDLEFVYNYISGTLTTSPAGGSVTENNGELTIFSAGDANLTWNTNLSDVKITVEQSAQSGDFTLQEARADVQSIDPNAVSVGSAGTAVGEVVVDTTPTDFITAITQAGGSAPLLYEFDLLIFDLGTNSLDITYTMVYN